MVLEVEKMNMFVETLNDAPYPTYHEVFGDDPQVSRTPAFVWTRLQIFKLTCFLGSLVAVFVGGCFVSLRLDPTGGWMEGWFDAWEFGFFMLAMGGLAYEVK